MDLDFLKEILGKVEAVYDELWDDCSDPSIGEVVEEVYKYYEKYVDFYKLIDSVGSTQVGIWLEELKKGRGL